MNPRDYQKELAIQGKLLLLKLKIVYFVMQMRVGKTVTSFETVKLCNLKSVLFITTKDAIKDIEKDYNEFNYRNYFELTVINYESLHKIDIKLKPDVVICDEAQSLGAFPKQNKRVKSLSKMLDKWKSYLILLSGTPSPESYSQLYHQFQISPFSPFLQWKNFYEWAKSGFVFVYQVRISGFIINKYEKADKTLIDKYLNKYFISYTQKEAGFKVTGLKDELIKVKTSENLHSLVKILLDDGIYTFKDGLNLICDTSVKLQNKIHQIYGGTVIIEDEGERTSKVLDNYKASFIVDHYFGKYKAVIFYLFDAEGELLKETFKGSWTDNNQVFNSTDKNILFIKQIKAGARGINLSSAELIIYYNIHFSSEIYQQSRQRAQEKNKETKTKIHWLFSDKGIEEKIYRRVINKQSYTLSYFKEDFL